MGKACVSVSRCSWAGSSPIILLLIGPAEPERQSVEKAGDGETGLVADTALAIIVSYRGRLLFLCAGIRPALLWKARSIDLETGDYHDPPIEERVIRFSTLEEKLQFYRR